MRWIRDIGFMALSTIVVLGLLEVVLRFLPVVDVTRTREISSSSTPFDVASNIEDELYYSRKWNFLNARTRRTNNLGFFSDRNFETGFSGVLAIGDSFTEAMQVDFEETYHQLIVRAINQEVYPLAISGAPLSQYEAYLREACTRYQPTHAIITIIENDFRFSHHATRERDGFFHYADDGELQASISRIGVIRKLANSSSLIRYVYFNLELGALLSRIGQASHNEPGDSTGLEQSTSVDDSATALFLENIGGYCLDTSHILFVVDANRYVTPGSTIYDDIPKALPRLLNFTARARAAGFAVIDLQKTMREQFLAHEERFEFSFDEHWNARGHQLVADAILRSDFLGMQ